MYMYICVYIYIYICIYIYDCVPCAIRQIYAILIWKRDSRLSASELSTGGGNTGSADQASQPSCTACTGFTTYISTTD